MTDDDRHSEFINANRFRCEPCDITMAVTASASLAAKQGFDRFCEEHAPHNVEWQTAKALRTKLVSD